MVEVEFILALFPLLLAAFGPLAAATAGAATASAIPALAGAATAATAAGAAGGVAGGLASAVGSAAPGALASAGPSAIPGGLLSAGPAADAVIANTPGLFAGKGLTEGALGAIPELGVAEGVTLANPAKEGLPGLLGLKDSIQLAPGSAKGIPSGLTGQQAQVATGTSNALSLQDTADLLKKGSDFLPSEEEQQPQPPPPIVRPAPAPSNQPLTPEVLLGLIQAIRQRQAAAGPVGSGGGLGSIPGLGSQTQGITF